MNNDQQDYEDHEDYVKFPCSITDIEQQKDSNGNTLTQ